jgi:phage terminase large subunit-like protein
MTRSIVLCGPRSTAFKLGRIEAQTAFARWQAPTRELEKLIVPRRLAHGGNPVTHWMGLERRGGPGPAGNLKPAKDKSTERIDGIVALIMALGRAMLPQEQPQPVMFWV